MLHLFEQVFVTVGALLTAMVGCIGMNGTIQQIKTMDLPDAMVELLIASSIIMCAGISVRWVWGF